MIEIAVTVVIVVASFSGFMLGLLAIVDPSAIPWGARGRAARQINAMHEWYSVKHAVRPLQSRAEGYFAVRDYIGVESAYIEARRIVDGEVQS